MISLGNQRKIKSNKKKSNTYILSMFYKAFKNNDKYQKIDNSSRLIYGYFYKKFDTFKSLMDTIPIFAFKVLHKMLILDGEFQSECPYVGNNQICDYFDVEHPIFRGPYVNLQGQLTIEQHKYDTH